MNLNSSHLTHFILENNISAEIVHLELDTPTVAVAATAVNAVPDQIAKSVLFLVEGQPLLVIGNGLRRIEWKLLANHLGVNRKRIKLANAGQVLAITGYPVGAVPPFGHKERLPTLIETRVREQTEIYAGGGEINALLRLTTAELQRVVRGEVVTLTE